MNRFAWLLPLGLGFVAGAQASDDSKPTALQPNGDRSTLIGTWVIYEFHDDGSDKTNRLTGRSVNPRDKPDALPRLVFTQDECFILRPSKSGWLRDIHPGLTNVAWKTYQLDESTKPHKSIVITSYQKTPETRQRVYPGIYELNGKSLRICWHETPTQSNRRRPTEFKSDGDMNLLVCEKISDEPLKPSGEYDPKPTDPKTQKKQKPIE